MSPDSAVLFRLRHFSAVKSQIVYKFVFTHYMNLTYQIFGI